ncbi:DUF2895 family protein, partial [Klebsiella pneumoniae]|uniref:DUF2895 family protein n=1 Tax=Klebsiella pneumoniae TaxID=573 RepID=UPI002181EDB6
CRSSLHVPCRGENTRSKCPFKFDHNNPELNPFGLALDCFAAMPQRLEAAPVDVPEKKGIF